MNRGAKFLVGAGIYIVVVSWALTQGIAWWYAYHPALGTSLFHTGIYWPWKSIQWSAQWYAVPHAGLFRFAPVYGMICALPLAWLVSLYVAPKHGDESPYSVWGTLADARRAKLTAKHGIVLGKLRGTILRHNGDEHALIIAPTGSHKTTAYAIPTLLEWPGHVLVNDPKGELADATAGYRQTFSRVYRFNPMGETTCTINPLDAVRLRTEHEMRDVSTIARGLIDPNGHGNHYDHWESSVLSLFTAIILHGLYTKEATTLHALDRRILTNPDRSIEDTLQYMITTRHTNHGVHPAIARNAIAAKDLADREQSGVISTARRMMQLYIDDKVAKATAASDITMRDLYNAGPEPVSFYLETSVSNLQYVQPLLRLLWQQYFDAATEALTTERQRMKTLLLLDEFPSLGPFELLQRRLDLLRGYGVRFMGIAPSMLRIDQEYGRLHSFLDACHIRLFFAQNDPEAARRLAAMPGQTVRYHKTHGTSREWFDMFDGRQTQTTHARKENLLSETEVMQLSPHDAIVCVANSRPFRVQKVPYWKHRTWKRRVHISKEMHHA